MSGRRRPAPSLRGALLLEQAARDVRSGSSPSAAVQTALDAHPEFLRSVADDLRRGRSLSDALHRSDPTDPIETVIVQALRVAWSTGGHVADTLERGAEMLRERQAWADERRAHAAQARLSASLLTSVPVGFAAVGVASSARVRTAYVDVPLTVPLTVVGVLLNSAGWWWMRRLIEHAAR